MRDKVSIAVRNLPRDIRPRSFLRPTTTSRRCSRWPYRATALRELTELAERMVKVDIERAAGVGEVRLIGGLSRAVNV